MRERHAALVIQKAYRYHIRVMYGLSVFQARKATQFLLQKAALCITAGARGRLGRRKAKTMVSNLSDRGAYYLFRDTSNYYHFYFSQTLLFHFCRS